MAGDTNSWVSYFGAISGLIGASAWLAPWVYQKFTKPIIEAKIVSKFENTGKSRSTPCLMHFLALNIISLRRSFNIKDTNISVTYKDKKDKYTGTLFWARKNEWAGPNGERLTLNILPEDTLPFVGTIPKDITRKIYLTFKVDKAELEEFEEIDITFIEQSGCQSKVSIKSNMIDPDQILWDDRIWKVVPPNNL
ncbi:MAG: hypothetical protein ACC651_15485 [Candidatus Scalindua sp.]